MIISSCIKSRISSVVMISTSFYFSSNIMNYSSSASLFSSSSSPSISYPLIPKSVSTAAIMGRRPYMEDEFTVSNDQLYAAVFDGHGGAEVAKYANLHAYSRFAKLLEPRKGKCSDEEVGGLLTQSLLDVDKEVEQNRKFFTQGAAACVVYVNNNDGETSLITANVGDSRAVLSRNKTALDLSVDHKPNLPSEKKRIEDLGGYVKWVGDYDKKTGLPIEERGVYRVNGNLALSRSIGDAYMKPYITALADITTTKSSPDDEFVIIATDGLWDVFSSSTAVNVVHEVLQYYNQYPPEFETFNEADKEKFLITQQKQSENVKKHMASIIADLAYKYHSYDNITVVILWLK